MPCSIINSADCRYPRNGRPQRFKLVMRVDLVHFGAHMAGELLRISCDTPAFANAELKECRSSESSSCYLPARSAVWRVIFPSMPAQDMIAVNCRLRPLLPPVLSPASEGNRNALPTPGALSNCRSSFE